MTETTPEGPDEIEDDDFAVLDSMMPAEAARILRRVMRKARNAGTGHAEIVEAISGLNQARQNQADKIQALETTVAEQATALQQLNQARQAQANRLTLLEDRVTALEAV